VNPSSGALTLAVDVRHVVFDDFLLRVSVEDGGRPSLSDTTELRIVVSRDIALVTTTVDPSVIFAGVLASEHTAVVLAITLAVILTAIIAIAVTICILRRRAHSRRVFRATSESPGMPKGSAADGKAVWGCPELRNNDVELPNGQLRQVSDIVGSFRPADATAADELRLHQSPIRGYSECNGRVTSFNERNHSVTSSPPPSDHKETRFNHLQVFFSYSYPYIASERTFRIKTNYPHKKLSYCLETARRCGHSQKKDKKVKTSICIARIMYKTPLTRISSLKVSRQAVFRSPPTACKHRPAQ